MIASQIRRIAHEIYKKIETKEHRLSYLFLELTQRCNLNCLHCGSDCRSNGRIPELTTESWKKIIQDIHKNFHKSINMIITGGEPLIRHDLLEIGSYISSLGNPWGIVTNGYILNGKRIRDLKSAGISSITISLNGLENSHEILRNKKKLFGKTLRALKAIAKSQIKFSDVVTCVYPGNLTELRSIADLLLDLGIKRWRLFRIFASGRAQKNDNIILNFSQTQEMIEWIKNYKSFYKKKGLLINLSCEGYLPFSEDIQVRDEPFFCRAGINFASILCDGTVTGCSNNHATFYQGNIIDKNFPFIWENSFQDFREKKWLLKTICNDCNHLKKCKGSSIHHWQLNKEKPEFCYVYDLGKNHNIAKGL